MAGSSIPAVLDPKVFKAYDVRGIYPDELDEAGAYAIGRAYVHEFEPRAIAVGRDMRLSSPSMAEAVMRGAAEAGADVVDLGMVGTEMVYFAVGKLDLEGGIMVTASHNPKEYTGMKIVRRGALPVGGDSGLLDIRDRALSQSDTSGARHQTGLQGAHLATLGRGRPVLHRRRSGEATPRGDRCRERHGRTHASAGSRTAADRSGAVFLRAGRQLPEP